MEIEVFLEWKKVNKTHQWKSIDHYKLTILKLLRNKISFLQHDVQLGLGTCLKGPAALSMIALPQLTLRTWVRNNWLGQ